MSLPSALGNDPSLQPVTTRDYEAGFDLAVPRRTYVDVDGFWTDVFDDIVFASPNRAQIYYVNAPRDATGWCRGFGVRSGFRRVSTSQARIATSRRPSRAQS